MAYQSLYRRYRPRRFAELRGQEHVVKSLRNAVRDDRVGHAYLFAGPRGTGKTTSARILAKVLNCERPVEGEPCCECASCLAVEAGGSYDVHELDAASNNGVDNMRDLIEKASLGTPGRHKVYILDEVHMLSKAAEAALLKTLEEPPPHVVFVLATTDPQKVSETIRSRTQQLAFGLLNAATLTEYVRWVAADAGLDVSDDAVEAVVRQGGGSARDTLSALEQVVAAGGVAPDTQPLDDVVDAIAAADTAGALAAIAVASNAGRDARTLTEHLVAQLRDAFLSLMAPDLVALPDAAAARVADQGRRLGAATTVRAMEVLGEILVEMRHAPDPRVLLDIALVRLTNAAADTSPGALLARIERLERGQAPGGMPAGGAVEPAPEASPAAARVAARAAGGRAALGGRAQRADAPPAPSGPAGEQPAPAPDAGPPATAAAPAAPASPAASSDGPLPSRDQLTLAWPDHVLRLLKGRAKALFAAGRFVEGDGATAVLALPNAPHRDACEAMRPQVEDALAAHFGRAVPLRLVVDGATAEAPAQVEPEPGPERIDADDLVDAPPESAHDPIERVAQAFPGAQLLDDDGRG